MVFPSYPLQFMIVFFGSRISLRRCFIRFSLTCLDVRKIFSVGVKARPERRWSEGKAMLIFKVCDCFGMVWENAESYIVWVDLFSFLPFSAHVSGMKSKCRFNVALPLYVVQSSYSVSWFPIFYPQNLDCSTTLFHSFTFILFCLNIKIEDN